MPNRAYLRVWTRDFSESTLIAEFARFLATAPLSTSSSAFTGLAVQAVDPAESPVAEWDLRDQNYGSPEVAALAAQYLNADTAYFASAQWDLWGLDVETLKWRHEPQPLLLACHGPLYDDGIAVTAGHFMADLGFEHFFTGHGGLLAPGVASNPFDSSDHPVEHTFRPRSASSAASCGPREKRILRRGWTPFSRSVNLELRLARQKVTSPKKQPEPRNSSTKDTQRLELRQVGE